MTSRSPAAMRASLDARLSRQASSLGIDAGRLRRRLVFQRILRRLSADGTWVLKGGYLLESRLGTGFRTTRDLDLAMTVPADEEDLVDRQDIELARDPDDDHFVFDLTGVTPLSPDSAGRGGWRISVTATLAGRPFSLVRIDVVQRAEEIAGGTEVLELPPAVDGVGFEPSLVVAADIAQHAAEKFHALCRTYAGSRPSTRVKDLLDIALMIDAGLLPTPSLRNRLTTVFRVRDDTTPPQELPVPPSAWREDFYFLVQQVSPELEFDEALRRAAHLYREAASDP